MPVNEVKEKMCPKKVTDYNLTFRGQTLLSIRNPSLITPFLYILLKKYSYFAFKKYVFKKNLIINQIISEATIK